MHCPIAISLSPNTEPEDVRRAFSLLLNPFHYRIKNQESQIKSLEREFKKYFDVPFAWSFNSGRSALYILLKALAIGHGDGVLVQAFTCNAVPNPVLWAGADPVYVDIERGAYNIDPADLERKITPRTKALVIQHTFGIPADLERILPIARAHGLFVIEDCAHALGGTYGSRKQEAGSREIENNNMKSTSYLMPDARYGKIGTFGDAAFFSFGRDKVISSVYGGMLITKDAKLAEKIDAEYKKLLFPSLLWVFQQLLHPIIFAVALPLYGTGLGKFIIWCAQKLHLLSKAVTAKERAAGKPDYFPRRLPETLANLALSQFKRLEKFNAHRKTIANYYKERLLDTSYQLPDTSCHDPVWLRFPIQHPRASEVIAAARKKGIYLGDWYREVIAPAGTDFASMRYQTGSCPVAEETAKRIINLPTYPRCSLFEAKKVIGFLARFSE